jgi:hypothetical protein
MSSGKATGCHQQGLEPKITEVESARFTKNAGFEKLTYLLPKMVGVLDKRWSQILPSLYVLQSRLEKLGVIYANNKVSYVDREGVRHE